MSGEFNTRMNMTRKLQVGSKILDTDLYLAVFDIDSYIFNYLQARFFVH